MENAVRELRTAISKAQTACGSLEIEASADLIQSLEGELDEFRAAAASLQLRPLPGETGEQVRIFFSS